MKTVLYVILVVLLPLSASAHPGKTDYRGGHKCWKNCGQWELRRGEYHLHDKDWNPIRLDQKGDVVDAESPQGVPIPDKRFLLEEPANEASRPYPGPSSGVRDSSGAKMPDQHVTLEKRQTVTVYEESFLPFSTVLLILLAMLMLVVLIFARRKREKK